MQIDELPSAIPCLDQQIGLAQYKTPTFSFKLKITLKFSIKVSPDFWPIL